MHLGIYRILLITLLGVPSLIPIAKAYEPESIVITEQVHFSFSHTNVVTVTNVVPHTISSLLHSSTGPGPVVAILVLKKV